MSLFLHEKFNGYDNGWWEIVGDKLVNVYGGYHHYHPKEDDEIVEAKDFDELDWTGCLLNERYSTGWIAPDGTWYPCRPQDHCDVAHFVLRSTEKSLETHGYIKVFYDNYDGKDDFYGCRRFTEKQKEKLLELGYKEEYIEYKDSPFLSVEELLTEG